MDTLSWRWARRDRSYFPRFASRRMGHPSCCGDAPQLPSQLWGTCVDVRIRSVDGDAAGAGAEADGGATAVDAAGDMVLAVAGLHGYGPVYLDAARAGVGLEVEPRVRCELNADSAGAGLHAPLTCRVAFDLHGAGA